MWYRSSFYSLKWLRTFNHRVASRAYLATLSIPIDKKDEFVKILFLLDNQEMTAKMLAAGKQDQRITTTLDRAEADARQNEPAAVAKAEKKALKLMAENKKRFETILAKQKKKQKNDQLKNPTSRGTRG